MYVYADWDEVQFESNEDNNYQYIDVDQGVANYGVSTFTEKYDQMSQELRLLGPKDAKLQWSVGAYFDSNDNDVVSTQSFDARNLLPFTPPAVPPQPQLRAQLEALGQPLCHQLLVIADPVAGARIMANDAVRTQRALEVLYATGTPLSAQQGAEPPPWRVLELGLNPPDLKARIGRASSPRARSGRIFQPPEGG